MHQIDFFQPSVEFAIHNFKELTKKKLFGPEMGQRVLAQYLFGLSVLERYIKVLSTYMTITC